MMARRLHLLLLISLLTGSAAFGQPLGCPNDANGDGKVAMAEVRAAIVLAALSPSEDQLTESNCESGLYIEDLVAGVYAANEGCGDSLNSNDISGAYDVSGTISSRDPDNYGSYQYSYEGPAIFQSDSTDFHLSVVTEILESAHAFGELKPGGIFCLQASYLRGDVFENGFGRIVASRSETTQRLRGFLRVIDWLGNDSIVDISINARRGRTVPSFDGDYLVELKHRSDDRDKESFSTTMVLPVRQEGAIGRYTCGPAVEVESSAQSYAQLDASECWITPEGRFTLSASYTTVDPNRCNRELTLFGTLPRDDAKGEGPFFVGVVPPFCLDSGNWIAYRFP